MGVIEGVKGERRRGKRQAGEEWGRGGQGRAGEKGGEGEGLGKGGKTKNQICNLVFLAFARPRAPKKPI